MKFAVGSHSTVLRKTPAAPPSPPPAATDGVVLLGVGLDPKFSARTTFRSIEMCSAYYKYAEATCMAYVLATPRPSRLSSLALAKGGVTGRRRLEGRFFRIAQRRSALVPLRYRCASPARFTQSSSDSQASQFCQFHSDSDFGNPTSVGPAEKTSAGRVAGAPRV